LDPKVFNVGRDKLAFTVAFHDRNKNKTKNLDDYIQALYYVSTRTGGERKDKFYASADCSVTHSDAMEIAEFSDAIHTTWNTTARCPEIDTIELLNDPFLFAYGININMVVLTCFQASAELNVSNATCKNSEETWSYIDKVDVETQFVTNTFDPVSDGDDWTWIVMDRNDQQFSKNMTLNSLYVAQRNNIDMFSKPWWDLRGLNMFHDFADAHVFYEILQNGLTFYHNE